MTVQSYRTVGNFRGLKFGRHEVAGLFLILRVLITIKVIDYFVDCEIKTLSKFPPVQ